MQFFKSLIPNWLLKFIRPIYHGTIALCASYYFGQPSEKIIIIGITGTTGKSTTAAMLAEILNFTNHKCGFITTVNFFDGNQDEINKHGLSMPGGFILQKQLSQIYKNGCKYAIIECTSEGLDQNRHLGVNFDMAVFTNLSHAHVEAHGSFGNYQQAKGKLFFALQKGKRKSFFPEKMIGMNFDDPMAGYFLSFPADKKFGVSFKRMRVPSAQKVFFAKVVKPEPPAEFEIEQIAFSLDMLGAFNVFNATLAAVCAQSLGVSLEQSSQALKSFHGVAGRMENIVNALGFKVIVDYGCEPESFKTAIEAAAQLPHEKLIHVFGSTGGHRDISKQFIFGKTSALFADVIIVTNDDVYSSDPEQIAKNIEAGIESFKLRKPIVQIVLDRKVAIAKALSLAQKNDLILISGKGSEQFLVLPGNKRVEWDDREVVKEELKKISNAK